MTDGNNNIPEWLTAVLGESPLLKDEEWQFIVHVRSSILEEIRSEESLPPPGDGDHDLPEKLSAIKDNFASVAKHLKNNYSRRHHFMKVYLKWKLIRRCNVEYLKNIADSVEDTRQKCQAASAIGSCISLIGGAVGLVATMKSSRLGQINGCAMMGIGSVTSAGSSVAEVGLLYRKVKEAEDVLREDKEALERLWDWLSDGTVLQQATESLRDIDVEVNIKFAANLFQNSFKKKRSDAEVQKYVKMVVSLLNISPEFAEEIADTVAILTAMSMLYDRYRPLFELASAGFKFSKQLRATVDLFRASMAVSTAAGSLVKEATELKLAVSMVLDLINIFRICKNFQSESRQARVVKRAACMLEKEALVFEKLYNEVKDLDAEDFRH